VFCESAAFQKVRRSGVPLQAVNLPFNCPGAIGDGGALTRISRQRERTQQVNAHDGPVVEYNGSLGDANTDESHCQGPRRQPISKIRIFHAKTAKPHCVTSYLGKGRQ
jgi:hypothetical protein